MSARPKAPPSKAPPQAVEEVRREVDRIDSELLALLRRRAEAVSRLPRAKARRAPWRPAREAAHLAALRRQAAERRPGGPPPLAPERVERLWRAVFNDSVASQRPLRVLLSGVPEEAARRHFGFEARLERAPSPAAALAALAGPWEVALLPLARWPLLLAPGRAALFAHLLLPGAAGAPAMAVAPFPPEPSGRDLALVAAAWPLPRGARAALPSPACHVSHLLRAAGTRPGMRLLALSEIPGPEALARAGGARLLGSSPR